MKIIYILLICILLYYLVYTYSNTNENFDPSLVPVSSIIKLAKYAQKLVDGGNVVLSNLNDLYIKGSGNTLLVGENLTINGTYTTEKPIIMDEPIILKQQQYYSDSSPQLPPKNTVVSGLQLINQTNPDLNFTIHAQNDGIEYDMYNPYRFYKNYGLNINANVTGTPSQTVMKIYGYKDPHPKDIRTPYSTNITVNGLETNTINSSNGYNLPNRITQNSWDNVNNTVSSQPNTLFIDTPVFLEKDLNATGKRQVTTYLDGVTSNTNVMNNGVCAGLNNSATPGNNLQNLTVHGNIDLTSTATNVTTINGPLNVAGHVDISNIDIRSPNIEFNQRQWIFDGAVKLINNKTGEVPIKIDYQGNVTINGALHENWSPQSGTSTNPNLYISNNYSYTLGKIYDPTNGSWSSTHPNTMCIIDLDNTLLNKCSHIAIFVHGTMGNNNRGGCDYGPSKFRFNHYEYVSLQVQASKGVGINGPTSDQINKQSSSGWGGNHVSSNSRNKGCRWGLGADDGSNDRSETYYPIKFKWLLKKGVDYQYVDPSNDPNRTSTTTHLYVSWFPSGNGPNFLNLTISWIGLLTS